MARKVRQHVAGAIYHVTMRGNGREPIFFRESDCCKLSELFAEGLTRYKCRLHAFCWMTNHFHAAVQVSDQPLSGLMCWLPAQYARYINKLRNRSGHLFERRHSATLVTDDAYLLNLLRYIHNNPVKAGLVSDPANYVWSSHRCYLGVETLDWVTTRPILSCFGDSTARARRQYRRYMAIDTDWAPTSEEPRDKEEDEAIEPNELAIPCNLKPTADELNDRLDELVAKYCHAAGLKPAVIVGHGRKRDAARARGRICAQALADGTATLAELAAYFDRAPEVISRGIIRHAANSSSER